MHEEGGWMSAIEPPGEHLRKAVRWISEECREEGGKTIRVLIEEACLRFNLSPMDEEFLISFFKKKDR